MMGNSQELRISLNFSRT